MRCLVGAGGATSAAARSHAHIKSWILRSDPWRDAPNGGLYSACDSRRGRRHIAALLRAGADPFRVCGTLSPLQICTLDDAEAGALPERAETTAVVREALRPWHPERHGLFPQSFARRVMAVLVVQRRLGLWEEWVIHVAPFLPRFSPMRLAAAAAARAALVAAQARRAASDCASACQLTDTQRRTLEIRQIRRLMKQAKRQRRQARKQASKAAAATATAAVAAAVTAATAAAASAIAAVAGVAPSK